MFIADRMDYDNRQQWCTKQLRVANAHYVGHANCTVFLSFCTDLVGKLINLIAPTVL